MAYSEQVIKSTQHQTLSIYSFDWGTFRVVRSFRDGYKTKDFNSYEQAKAYANKIANIMR